MFKSTSTSLILRGVLAVIVGIIAIAWPNITVLALVIVFAIYAFTDAIAEFARAFSSRTAGPVFGHLLLGLIDIAAGIVALAWPGPTALVLVIVVAAWAIVSGFFELYAAFGSGGDRRHACHVHPGRAGVHRVRRRDRRQARYRRDHRDLSPDCHFLTGVR